MARKAYHRMTEICPDCLRCTSCQGASTLGCTAYSTCTKFRRWLKNELEDIKETFKPAEPAGRIHIATFEEGVI